MSFSSFFGKEKKILKNLQTANFSNISTPKIYYDHSYLSEIDQQKKSIDWLRIAAYQANACLHGRCQHFPINQFDKNFTVGRKFLAGNYDDFDIVRILGDWRLQTDPKNCVISKSIEKQEGLIRINIEARNYYNQTKTYGGDYFIVRASRAMSWTNNENLNVNQKPKLNSEKIPNFFLTSKD